jgi:hypothetical protein
VTVFYWLAPGYCSLKAHNSPPPPQSSCNTVRYSLSQKCDYTLLYLYVLNFLILRPF